MTKDEYVIALAEVGVELSSTNKTHYEALAQAIGYAEEIEQYVNKEERLKEVLRKNRENMVEMIREESWKIERVHKEISEYPAPVIPKREALEIINRAMKGE
jgi:hypothetical protein